VTKLEARLEVNVPPQVYINRMAEITARVTAPCGTPLAGKPLRVQVSFGDDTLYNEVLYTDGAGKVCIFLVSVHPGVHDVRVTFEGDEYRKLIAGQGSFECVKIPVVIGNKSNVKRVFLLGMVSD